MPFQPRRQVFDDLLTFCFSDTSSLNPLLTWESWTPAPSCVMAIDCRAGWSAGSFGATEPQLEGLKERKTDEESKGSPHWCRIPWWGEEGLGRTTKTPHPRPSSVSPASFLKCVWWEKRETYQNHTEDRLSGREIEQWCLRRFRRCFLKASVKNRKDKKCFRGLRGKVELAFCHL